jgi:hypothetical protein
MQASKDQNHISSKLGLLYTDGVTPVPIQVKTDGSMACAFGLSITFDPENIAPRDENAVPVWLGRNSVTGAAIPIYVTENGQVLMEE